MKEIQSIIHAYETFQKDGKKSALATVVQVDGSAYRRPGARMLVSEDGELTGAISGGCLEGDALRKAQTVIFQQKSMLVTYDTTDEDDQKFGVGLGCNGIIHVLLEPIDYQNTINPIELLKTAISDRSFCRLISIFSVKYSKQEQVGTKVLLKGNQIYGDKDYLNNSLWTQIQNEIDSTESIDHIIRKYKAFDDVQVFIESIKPAIRILLFGAGNDTIPIANMAVMLGLEVIVIDGRKNLATTRRFPSALKIITGSGDEVVAQLESDKYTVALLMTHNFEYEAQILVDLVKLDLPYMGILGPKKKSEKLIERLERKGITVNQENIYSPMGLDIGAEGSEEIALSILAEVKAVLAKKQGTFLRNKKGPIHEENR
ncbi:xanthine/CO dehydrogenase XdhC/CoxF family maturation factor [Algoriphagus ratkowskyi]|uniref:Xanthine/CO dehydrogenase XdhC/CoxF family maturation factor n=1 Tax=Algoriphagus ratkowskyi TaxID=57028 RepID=A0A2W7T161_9BACT|nr:XdhC/CoxI family protein [Algoriphagus ratkowskyi]PZX56922.1 xanthine/CO dehydrogenase XdhC/CoxF family maturation factor [Algoriphagus ratkowskyi]TXD79834.1 XdhC family protein [Algoriphagus ratkowskyi]